MDEIGLDLALCTLRSPLALQIPDYMLRFPTQAHAPLQHTTVLKTSFWAVTPQGCYSRHCEWDRNNNCGPRKAIGGAEEDQPQEVQWGCAQVWSNDEDVSCSAPLRPGVNSHSPAWFPSAE